MDGALAGKWTVAAAYAIEQGFTTSQVSFCVQRLSKVSTVAGLLPVRVAPAAQGRLGQNRGRLDRTHRCGSQPLFDSLAELLRERSCLHADETLVRKLNPSNGITRHVRPEYSTTEPAVLVRMQNRYGQIMVANARVTLSMSDNRKRIAQVLIVDWLTDAPRFFIISSRGCWVNG